ncbi:MAG: DUF2997 domain-containing protein [Cyanobacteriota bacterium]|nr:DUF2997 domain-containing protein [Cyanobacteriota bacterium]
MALQTIRFRIRPDGRVEETVESVPGPSCHTLTERVESRLGRVERRQPTAEAFLTQASGHHQTVQPLHNGSGH